MKGRFGAAGLVGLLGCAQQEAVQSVEHYSRDTPHANLGIVEILGERGRDTISFTEVGGVLACQVERYAQQTCDRHGDLAYAHRTSFEAAGTDGCTVSGVPLSQQDVRAIVREHGSGEIGLDTIMMYARKPKEVSE